MAVACSAGAFSVVLAAAVLAIGCSSAPARSLAQARANAATAERVRAALRADPVFYLEHVSVSVDRGVTTLGGLVWTDAALYRAQEIARAVPGVTRTEDQMELERAPVR